jgi:hypothetical protein
MKKFLAIFVATTALTAAIGLPALSAKRAQEGAEERPSASVFDDDHGQAALPLVLASDDEDDDNHRSGHDDDDEDDEASGAMPNPDPAGSAAPPKNGLFGNGLAPKVQVN